MHDHKLHLAAVNDQALPCNVTGFTRCKKKARVSYKQQSENHKKMGCSKRLQLSTRMWENDQNIHTNVLDTA
jgi:hypothetical protein